MSMSVRVVKHGQTWARVHKLNNCINERYYTRAKDPFPLPALSLI